MSCIQSSNTCQILPKITKYRDDKIRTCDPRDPNTVRYQAALHPDKIVKSTYSVFNFLRYHLFKNLPIGVTFCSAECCVPIMLFFESSRTRCFILFDKLNAYQGCANIPIKQLNQIIQFSIFLRYCIASNKIFH